MLQQPTGGNAFVSLFRRSIPEKSPTAAPAVAISTPYSSLLPQTRACADGVPQGCAETFPSKWGTCRKQVKSKNSLSLECVNCLENCLAMQEMGLSYVLFVCLFCIALMCLLTAWERGKPETPIFTASGACSDLPNSFCCFFFFFVPGSHLCWTIKTFCSCALPITKVSHWTVFWPAATSIKIFNY